MCAPLFRHDSGRTVLILIVPEAIARESKVFRGLPNVGVSRAAGRCDEEKWRHRATLKSRAQVGAAPAASGCTRCWAALLRGDFSGDTRGFWYYIYFFIYIC